MRGISHRALSLLVLLASLTSAATAADRVVGTSPWGPNDEIGRLNLITPKSQAAVLSRLAGGQNYDLSVEYFIGMPSWQAAGDPHYRMWMTHTPHGTVIDDPLNLGKTMNQHVSYTGAAISMYTHMGTHIDALNHFGLDGKIWNGFSAAEHVGDPSARAAGATHEAVASLPSNGASTVSDQRRSKSRIASGSRASHAARLGPLRQLAASNSGT